MISTKEPIVFDTELIGSGDNIFFLFAAKHLASQTIVRARGDDPIAMQKMTTLLRNPRYVFISFNGIRFDAPVLQAVMDGRSLGEVKRMANDIINDNKPAFASYRDYKLEWPEFDHIDLIEVAPGVMISLKLYAARMGMESLIDLPYEHDTILGEKQRQVVMDYCDNDLAVTEALWEKLTEAIELREHMSERYKLDLRSKSDAQMAEAIVAKELGIRSAPKDIPSFVRYKAPPFVQPRNMVLIEKLEQVQRHSFKIDKRNGSIEFPEFLVEPILLGKGRYQMGIGGLHSQHDRCCYVEATPDYEIVDADVSSHYPTTIVNSKLSPRGLDNNFLSLYTSILLERLEAKKEQNALKAEIEEVKRKIQEQSKLRGLEVKLAQATMRANSGKLQLNGAFGKFGSMFSKIYSPDLLLATTLSGQFYLLALIEELIGLGVNIISANTDGVCFGGSPAEVKAAMDWIECYGFLTNFEFEFTRYRRIALKDVNNYIAVKTDGKVKAKGIYALSGLMKNPTNEVCTLAAQAYLRDGTPIEDFIRNHLRPENIADFTQSRTVNGGAIQYAGRKIVDDWVQVAPREWKREAWGPDRSTVKRVSRPKPVEVGGEPVFLGRIARWYYSTDAKLSINYRTNDNLVGKSEGGRACLKLPTSIPADLDLGRYVAETKTNLRNMGVPV